MAEKDFLRPEAGNEARRAVEDVELQTSIELVVALRHSSGRYREADYLFGFLLSVLTLLALLFLPQPFALWSFPLDVVLSFVLGAWLSSRAPALRRLLVPAAARREATRAAAQLEFSGMRLSRLPARNAILVYLSLFEREAVVVPDLGVDPQRCEPAWSNACARLGLALRRGPDWTGALEAIRVLGPALARAYPRAAADVNELPDEMLRR